MLVCALVTLFGTRAEAFAWASVNLVLVLAGIYYPVSVLPAPAAAAAAAIPLTYFLDAYRAHFGFPSEFSAPLTTGFALSAVYAVLAHWVFRAAVERARQTGCSSRCRSEAVRGTTLSARPPGLDWPRVGTHDSAANRRGAMTTGGSDFREQLEKAVNARHSRLNPFTEKWVKGELTRAQLGAWVCQHYQYVSQFARWCAAVYAECPDADARDFLLENIVEEESGVKHVDLLIRFGEACGVSRAAGGDHAAAADHARADRVVLRDLAAAVPHRRRRAAGRPRVAGARHLPAQPAALRTHYGFNDREVEFFAIHIEADEVHGERGYQIVERHCTTPAMQEEALDQVRQATEMRWQYMSGLYRAFVAKEEP